jgi:methyl-accepting chemotaxis protein
VGLLSIRRMQHIAMNQKKQNWNQIQQRKDDTHRNSKPSDFRKRIKWYQRTYLVNKELQLKYARSGALIGFISTIISTGMLLTVFYSFNIWQGQRFPTPVLLVMITVFILNISGIYVATVISTQKIAGPLFNLVRQFTKIKQHDFSVRARFREGDEFQNVAQEFNEMMESLSERELFIIKKIDSLKVFIQEKNTEELISIVEEIEKKIKP